MTDTRHGALHTILALLSCPGKHDAQSCVCLWQCRSLPYQALLAELAKTTGQQVFQGNVRYALTQAFGPDASLKAQAYLGVSSRASNAVHRSVTASLLSPSPLFWSCNAVMRIA